MMTKKMKIGRTDNKHPQRDEIYFVRRIVVVLRLGHALGIHNFVSVSQKLQLFKGLLNRLLSVMSCHVSYG